jgi:hypothetical protein
MGRQRNEGTRSIDALSGADVHGTVLIMKVKMHDHYWMRCGEILRLLQVRYVVHGRVRSGPKVGGSPISVLCSMAGGLSWLPSALAGSFALLILPLFTRYYVS